ncbi:Cellulose synthase - like 10 [Theobroma cacao]|nr:Cellulose synthase - like 10 [Theobroma cacao]
MAYDYPTEKISIYVSDDEGSALTLFAFMEATKFASYWLPFTRENNIMDRNPDEIYENMKVRVENVVNRGDVSEIYVSNDEEREAFNKWTGGFTPQGHPTVIQVLLDSSKDKDITAHFLPNLIFVPRQKSKTSPHHFKAGALNVLLRVSTVMTNAPIILTQECDMYSNDPQTPLRVLCYLCDPAIEPNLGFIQFPQRFPGDHIIVGLEPSSVGEHPSAPVKTEILELSPDHVVNKPIKYLDILPLAHHVASCNYENQTKWGSKVFYTGYRLQCDGWRSICCNPERAAFLGNIPINLVDVLGQCNVGPDHLCLPQLALPNGVSVFPEISEPWFFLYLLLLLGAYGQDFLEYVLEGATCRKWWNAQRMWMIRKLWSFSLGAAEYFLKSIGLSTYGFIVINKAVDDEQNKRYCQGMFEFGVPSPLFVPPTMAAIINLFSFIWGTF